MKTTNQKVKDALKKLIPTKKQIFPFLSTNLHLKKGEENIKQSSIPLKTENTVEKYSNKRNKIIKEYGEFSNYKTNSNTIELNNKKSFLPNISYKDESVQTMAPSPLLSTIAPSPLLTTVKNLKSQIRITKFYQSPGQQYKKYEKMFETFRLRKRKNKFINKTENLERLEILSKTPNFNKKKVKSILSVRNERIHRDVCFTSLTNLKNQIEGEASPKRLRLIKEYLFSNRIFDIQVFRKRNFDNLFSFLKTDFRSKISSSNRNMNEIIIDVLHGDCK